MKLVVLSKVALLGNLFLLTGCGTAAAVTGQSANPDKFLVQARWMEPPEWAKDAVFYQIFPERFANGDRKNDPPDTQSWGGNPTYFNFFGGDLKGIRQNLDYLQDLGVTALYLNPIFESPSNHKYNTSEYLRIDPSFGTMADFQALVADLHRRKMRIVLDGVFNHSGDTFWAFQEASASGPTSRYWTWYNFHGFPVVSNPKPNYDSWWGFGQLPKLNYNNPAVPNYVLDQVVDFWTRQGIDGWRLDVPNEITLPTFWSAFRQKVRSINPEAYLVGEIWDDPKPWLGNKFDATMNYLLRNELLAFVANRQKSVDAFDAALASQRANTGSATNVMFNILDSHDTPRFRYDASEDITRLRIAALLQLTYPGTPVIYYGDEIGMTGGKDPDNRRCFDWNRSRWDQETWRFYQQLIKIRKSHPALRDGWLHTVLRHNDKGLYVYHRSWFGKDRVMVVINNSGSKQELTVPVGAKEFAEGTKLQDLLKGTHFQVSGGKLALGQVAAPGMILAPDK
ncbi:MAG: glycoside hydrolase family 13 protein [Cyanobacteria bacterium NC_groundwater_1444_Ag_S-0.65um_54_12]|nr:glycoside hydrolase family 13 protein [Cyanobacteria bacterium NC_groundwater_1444_Ag_S-0.65um_54_12]